MKDYEHLSGWGWSVIIPRESGIDAAKRRHDALAHKRYAKPFKFFKFNRARKATAK